MLRLACTRPALPPAARRVGLSPRPPLAAFRRPPPPVQPAAARRGLATGGTSSYRGVSWYGPKGQWRARLWVDAEQHIGYFADEVLAARAVDDAVRARGLGGELNFPGEVGREIEAEIEAEIKAEIDIRPAEAQTAPPVQPTAELRGLAEGTPVF